MRKRIVIAEAFSNSPAGRVTTDGPYSGERFREEVLLPALREASGPIEVDLNGVLGFGSSFLEEAFGGLVRKGYYSAKDLEKRLKIASEIKTYERRIWAYIAAARREG